MVEKTYFSCDLFKKACIHCGSPKNLTTTVDSYPECNKQKCRNEKNVLKIKRKTVLAANLPPDYRKRKQMQILSVLLRLFQNIICP